MIFRLSQKLNAKIKAGDLQTLPLGENPFEDWSAHLFIAGRTQYILLSNTKALYSTVLYDKGIVDDARFIERALSSLRESLEHDGHESIYQRFIAPASATVRFAKALNRSVTGSMNDLTYEAKFLLVERDLSLFDVVSQINDTPMSALPSSQGDKYGTPREAFKRLGEINASAPRG
jgi:phosphoribosyl-ATP pyrophosphohydrolase